MSDFKVKEHKKFKKSNYSSFILGVDVGGTNTTFGVFGLKDKLPLLLLSLHLETRKIKSMINETNNVLFYVRKKYEISIKKACYGVAGVVSYERRNAKITNGKLTIEKEDLLRNTKLEKILIINDFEAIGYGINILDKKDIIIIKKAQKVLNAPIIVIGAGTGLGKTTLIYDEHSAFYIPIPSEAGHSDFAAQNEYELELINFIKGYKKIKKNVSYEYVLSGQGLRNIYLFLRKKHTFNETKYTKEIDKTRNRAELISKYRKVDKTCKTVFEMFKTIYARFAKNFALDCLAFGGVYIAGGISPKNIDIFDEGFVKIFQESHKMRNVLKKIPIYLILDCNIGLLGTSFAAFNYPK